jgi:hypothetical protein
MNFKVFISHSTRDKELVETLAYFLQQTGIKVYVAEWYLSPGVALDKKVFSQIEASDCVIVLLTKNGVRSNWVHQEIGYAIKTKKFIIPIVEKGIDSKALGALQGKEYIKYDPLKPMEAIKKIVLYVKKLKLKKEEKNKEFLLAAGIIAFLFFLANK